MNTPAHLIFGAAAFAKTGQWGVSVAAVLGALLPDLSLYLMAGWALYVQNVPANIVFDSYYFSDQWQAIFAVDNSFVLWGALFLSAVALRRPLLLAFSGSGLLHLMCDFVLHNEDARRQFWPISDWIFRSPVSYWDPHRFGHVIGPLEMTACAVLGLLLWRRFKGVAARGLTALALAAELLPGLMFGLMLGG